MKKTSNGDGPLTGRWTREDGGHWSSREKPPSSTQTRLLPGSTLTPPDPWPLTPYPNPVPQAAPVRPSPQVIHPPSPPRSGGNCVPEDGWRRDQGRDVGKEGLLLVEEDADGRGVVDHSQTGRGSGGWRGCLGLSGWRGTQGCLGLPTGTGRDSRGGRG